MRNLFFLLGFVLMGILSYSCSEDYEPAMKDNPKDAAAKSRCISFPLNKLLKNCNI